MSTILRVSVLLIIYMFIIEVKNGLYVASHHPAQWKTLLVSSEVARGYSAFSSQVLHDSANAWPWHHTHYLGGVLNGLPDTSSSSLKIPQMKSFFVFE